MDDFRKYATKHLGMNSLVLDDVIKSQAGYLNPYILEERQLNVTQLDVFSRLMMDRIIFLGTQVDDYTANTLQAQLLYLDSVDPGKDISTDTGQILHFDPFHIFINQQFPQSVIAYAHTLPPDPASNIASLYHDFVRLNTNFA